MGSQTRNWQSIDLFQLYTSSDYTLWNKWLTKCAEEENVTELGKVYYGVQAGMDDLVKEKLNTDKMNLFFSRLTMSIERTVRVILKRKYPSPLDDPQTAISMKQTNPKEYEKHYKEKKKRDLFYEQWLRKVAF
jgi:hypothetical protein